MLEIWGINVDYKDLLEFIGYDIEPVITFDMMGNCSCHSKCKGVEKIVEEEMEGKAGVLFIYLVYMVSHICLSYFIKKHHCISKVRAVFLRKKTQSWINQECSFGSLLKNILL